MIFQSSSPRRGQMVNVIKALISTSDRAPIFHMKISVSDAAAYASPSPHGDTSFPSIKNNDVKGQAARYHVISVIKSKQCRIERDLNSKTISCLCNEPSGLQTLN